MKKSVFFYIIIILFSCSSKKDYEIVEKDGIVLIKNYTNNLKKIDLKLENITKLNLDSYINTISSFCIDDLDNIYILDDSKKRVFVFNSKGDSINSFGKSGSGPGEFTTPAGIFINNSTVFVPDIITKKVLKFNLQGEFIEDIKNLESVPASLKNLHDSLFVGYIMNQSFDENGFIINMKLVILNSKLNVIKTIQEKKNKIDLNNIFSKNNDEATYDINSNYCFIEECSEDKFQINVYNLEGEITKKITKRYKKIAYSENEVQEKNDKIKKKLKGLYGDVKFDRKYKKAISGIFLDKLNQLWVKEATEDGISEDNIFTIFNSEGVLQGKIETEYSGDLFFKNDNIYFINYEENIITRANY